MSKIKFKIILLVVFPIVSISTYCSRESIPKQENNKGISSGPNRITLIARCKAKPPTESRRCNNLLAVVESANAELEALGDDRRIQLKIIQDDKKWGDYKTEFELASDAGEPPDIVTSGHEHIGDWASARLIIPITNMLKSRPEFDDMIEPFWKATEWNGERWGVPQDAEARLLFYSKPLLRQLGWSNKQIESLPDSILKSEFSWKDMIDVAEQAVNAKIVKPGNGWWHRPINGPDFLYYYFAHGGEICKSGDALTFDKKAALNVYRILYSASQEKSILSSTLLGMTWNEWHTAVSSADKVLFWFGGSWNWTDWTINYVSHRGGEDFLFNHIGFAAIPAGSTSKPITLTHPIVYMISSKCKHPDLALLMIAKVTNKKLNTLYAVESGHLGILKSQEEYSSYTNNKFLTEVMNILQFTTFMPNSPCWSTWSEAFFLGIQAVESGDLKPEEALKVVVDRLQNELAENVVIR